jgi:hypothetical protein
MSGGQRVEWIENLIPYPYPLSPIPYPLSLIPYPLSLTPNLSVLCSLLTTFASFMQKLLSLPIFILFGIQFMVAQSRDTLIEIAANPGAGFHFPYFLFIPAECQNGNAHYLLIESNNTGVPNDTFAVHEKAAKTQAQCGPLGNYLSKKLHTPYLVPVFPRPQKEWKVCTHMLDRDVMLWNKDPMKRIDLQLIAMIKDAMSKLKAKGFVLHEQVMMSGYSSSGVFANRFAVLHPEIIKAYSAGGINGLLMMPFSHYNTEELNYPLGTDDFQEITGSPFDFDSFQKIHQFLYMGESDSNDAVQMDDGYSHKEREIIYKTFGEKMLPDRWFACQLHYKIATHNVQFRTYSGVGHEMNEDILRDLVRFYIAAINE